MPRTTKSSKALTLTGKDSVVKKETRYDQFAMAAGGRAAAKSADMNYATQAQMVHPSVTTGQPIPPTVWERVRYYKRESSFLQMYMPLRRSILNYGFRLSPAEAGADEEGLQKWYLEDCQLPVTEFLDKQTNQKITIESTTSNWEAVCKYAENALDDFAFFDNVISMWVDGRDYALTLPIEKCVFTDVLNIPILRYTHGLGKTDIEKLEPEDQKRFQNATITFNVAEGEHFKVLTRTATGDGLSVPSIYSILRLLDEVESKEVGQNAMAFFMRTVKRMHKLGHEIKGPNAGKFVSHANWNKRRSDAVKNQWVDKIGVDDYTANFDEDISFPWPDLKVFDEVCWKGSDRRLYAWAGPVGQMLTLRGVAPWLPNLLKGWAQEERRKLGAYLSSVITRAFNPPIPVKCSWSDTIFNEARLSAELIKFAAQNGLVSATTAKREFCLDPNEEETLKVKEASDSDAIKKFTPIWDASHGFSPALGQTAASAKAGKGQDPASTNGKPAGTKQ